MKNKLSFGKEEYRDTNMLLNKKINERKPLIAVHRGISAGNIIENTIPSYMASIYSGGDMIEVDVVRSTDGIYYSFHDGNEKRLLNKRKNIKTMSSKEIEKLSYNNPIGEKTGYKVEKLSNILEYFQGKDVLINIDRAWDYFDDLLKFFDKYDVEKQIIIKSAPKKEFYKILKKHKTKYMYMPIVSTKKEVDEAIKEKEINLIGFELLGSDGKSIFFDEKYLENLREKGYFSWVNAIKLNDIRKLYGGYDDSISIIEGGDKGWGVLIEKGIDIIQTDWPYLLSKYIENKKK